jgi:hypothetical protein
VLPRAYRFHGLFIRFVWPQQWRALNGGGLVGVGYVLIKNRFDWWERGVRSVSRVLERLFVFL